MEANEIVIVLAFLSMLILLPVIVLGIYKRVWQSVTLFFILLVSIFSLLADLVGAYLGLVLKTSNAIVSHTWGIVELVILSAFFYKFLPKKTNQLTILAIPLLGYYIMDTLPQEELSVFPASFKALVSVLMILLSLLAFHQFMKDDKQMFIVDVPEFWVISGILIYFSGSLFTFLFSLDILTLGGDNFLASWYIHNGVLIIKNILFGIAFWKFTSSQITV